MKKLLLLAGMLAATVPMMAQDAAPSGPEPAPAAEAQVSPLPPAWKETDYLFTPRRYTVEVATFPSAALAESLRNGLMNMGWAPTYIEESDGRVRVTVGDFTSLGDAHYLAQEFRVTKLAEPRVINRPAGAQPSPVPINGPLLNPYLPSAAKPIDWQQQRARLQVLAAGLSEEQRPEFEHALEVVSLPGNDSEKGSAAMYLLRLLHGQKIGESDAVLYLAGKLASGEWPVTTGDRLYAAEIIADVRYGVERDWRGAWGATRDLMSNPERDREGLGRDLIRRAALMIDFAASDHEPKPSWNEVRAMLRRAWEAIPPAEERQKAKVELIYLQTFAWEGRWDRVEDLSKSMSERYSKNWPETGLAEIFHARSLERHENYREAVRILETVMGTEYMGPPLALGNETLNLHDRASKYWRHFQELQLQAVE